MHFYRNLSVAQLRFVNYITHQWIENHSSFTPGTINILLCEITVIPLIKVHQLPLIIITRIPCLLVHWRITLFNLTYISSDLVLDIIEQNNLHNSEWSCQHSQISHPSKCFLAQNESATFFKWGKSDSEKVQWLKVNNSSGPLDNQTWHKHRWPQQKLPKFGFHTQTTALCPLERSSIFFCLPNLFLLFSLQVKEIEKRDSVLTSSQQIERLTRPGSTYFNLNPYEVGFSWHNDLVSVITRFCCCRISWH